MVSVYLSCVFQVGAGLLFALWGRRMHHIAEKIDSIRKEWGNRLLILGHHYQRSSVIRHADETGDSLELARKAGRNRTAEHIVFCGVRFMAESADILTGPDQTVYMPEMSAGCPMADMADVASAEAAWQVLEATGGGCIPVVYVNSSAELKAFCGRRGGSTCTSSNAAGVFRWVLNQGSKVFFLPDEHLGANTARDLGIADDKVLLYERHRESGGLEPDRIKQGRVIVWKGFCLVHTAFTVEHVRRVREALPAARIIVHPEVPKEVVAVADAHGSTSQIIKYVEDAPDGSMIVIGTELNLVQRLAEQHRGRVNVKVLAPSVCANMSKTNEQNLLDLLENWHDERIVRVPEAVAKDAGMALERMLEL